MVKESSPTCSPSPLSFHTTTSSAPPPSRHRMATAYYEHDHPFPPLDHSDDSSEESSDSSSVMDSTPRFSRLLTSVLGSPFLTTSDLPFMDDISSLHANDDDDLETVDGTFMAVPRNYTVTRPPSPAPSFRTETYSIVDWTDQHDVFSTQARPSLSDAAPKCNFALRSSFLSGSTPGSSTFRHSPTPTTPYNSIRFPSPHAFKSSRSLNLLPKIWDAIRESSPTRKCKRRMDLTASIWAELEGEAFVDYASLPPLDGEEGELIDDEACFIDVRAVTGVDIISQLPDEIALYIISFLDIQDVLSCLAVSRIWRRFAQDNLIWKDLFKRRKCDGWDIDLRRITRRTPHEWIPLDWHELYKTRAELHRRWSPNPTVVTNFNSEDKENVSLWDPKVHRISGHMDSVYCLEFDSSKIITGSRDRTIKVWSLKTGKCLATFVGHSGSVLCLKFDKDWDLDDANTHPMYPSWKKGTMVSGSSDCLVFVWDVFSCSSEDDEGNVTQVVTANVRGVLRGHSGGVLDLRIDSKWIISCSKDAQVLVWDRETLALHRTFRGHEGPVNALGLQGDKVVSASGDGKMMLWDISSGERLRTFEGHDRGLACIEFKDDIIVSGSNDCKIKVWKASTGECVRTLTGHESLVRALSFDSRSGRLVSGSYDRSVKIWNLETGKLVREFRGCHSSHIFDVRFDCSRIVSTSHDQKIVILDFTEGLDTTLFV
ncbi:hypothetical protein QCA50_013226 [Cerrena zonata]|uniref:F-box domain-containing protein n=1 Tax=Cerrena zonata TaxID=2478898 RepID=A0AAW0FS24_9APHY